MARTKEFSPDKLIENAMYLFWRKGYFDTSMNDLVEATGVQRYGIYSTFKNKHNLFLETLKYYRLAVKRSSFHPLTQSDASLPEIIETINLVAHNLTQNNGLGCFINNSTTELAATDPEVATLILEYINMIKELLRNAVENGIRVGEISQTESVDSLVNYLLGIIVSLPNLTSMSQSDSFVRDFLDGALAKFQ